MYYNIPIYTHIIGTAAYTTAWKVVPMSGTTKAETDIRAIEVFNGSGEVIELGYGASTGAAVTLQYAVIPGGTSQPIAFLINQNMRLFARAPVNNVTDGSVVYNFLR